MMKWWDFCVSVVTERGGIDSPYMEQPVDMTAIYTCIISHFGYISLEVVQQRLKITSPHFRENLFL